MRQTSYYCDRCRREVERPCDLSVVPLPARIVNPRTERIEQVMQEIELCQHCMGALHRLCERQFALVTVSGDGVCVVPMGVPAADEQNVPAEGEVCG